MSWKWLKREGKRWLLSVMTVLLGLLTLCLYVRCLLWRPFAVTVGTFGILGGLVLWENRERLMVRFASRFTAAQRLNRFLHSGKKIRVVCFGRPEEGEAPGFHLALDGTPRQDSGLTALIFSGIEPGSLARHTAAYQGKTAEAYCYLNSRVGVQLTGMLETGEDGLWLAVCSMKLSGRAKEVPIHPRDRIFSVIVDFL